MPRPQHGVRLPLEERAHLTALLRPGDASAQTHLHARLLRRADCSAAGPAWDEGMMATAVAVRRPTRERGRRALAPRGRTAALERKVWTGPARRQRDGAQEAQRIALTCSAPPQGAERWPLAWLADKLVERKVVATMVRETGRVALNKTHARQG